MINSIYTFMHSSNYILLSMALVLLFSIVSQILAWKFKLPSILFLIISGILLGTVSESFLPGGLRLVDGEIIFGQGLSPFVSICVAIILFEGSLSLNFSKIKGVSGVVFKLITLGASLTVIFTALFCHYIIGLSAEISCLIGGITCVSGPTVVPPLMRTVRPKKHISNILEWEATIVDPIGAITVIFIMSWFYLMKDNGIVFFTSHAIIVCLFGVVSGIIMGFLVGLCVRNEYLPEYLKSFFVLSSVIVSFIAIDFIMHGIGLLMVTVMGMFIANMKNTNISDVISFKENLSIVIISVLFIVLSADIDFNLLSQYWFDLLLIFIFLQFILRPLVVFICSYKSTKLTLKEKIVMGMIYPRGIVAASVAALVSVKLLAIDSSFNNNSEILIFFVFMIILATVVFQSLFVPYISSLLGVSEPEGKGFLIVGGDLFARELALAFTKKNIEIIITDSSWTNVQKCRQMGLNIYYGSPVSLHADWNISLIGIGSMLGLSKSEYVNTISAVKYTNELSSKNIYILRSESKESYKGTGSISKNYGKSLFEKGMDYSFFEEKIREGAKIKTTNITLNYSYDSFFKDNKSAIPLFLIDSKGKAVPFTGQTKVNSINLLKSKKENSISLISLINYKE